MENVRSKWAPEIHHYCPTAPIILCGTMSDVLSDPAYPVKGTRITSARVEEIAKEARAVASLKCSAMTQEGLKEGEPCAVAITCSVLIPRVQCLTLPFARPFATSDHPRTIPSVA